jgi:hypothetical protein
LTSALKVLPITVLICPTSVFADCYQLTPVEQSEQSPTP